MEKKETLRKDYQALPVVVESVDLVVSIHEDTTTVRSTLRIRKTPSGVLEEGGLFLDGRSDVHLQSIAINGIPLDKALYTVSSSGLLLALAAIPECARNSDTVWTLTTEVSLKPQENSLLEGLYVSGGMYCTQCEAQGFRGITYFFDRPDIMSKYTVRIEADKTTLPVLLSNGNLIESGTLPAERHFALWHDPWPKPSYLFALVAGQLVHKEDIFTTRSGEVVTLRIYVQERNIGRVDHAMVSLQKSMKWDELTYGLEYDLKIFNIVAVDDFNMGAMENKSLNIFNSKLVLATHETATDTDFGSIESVIGHEYFHNWTGNRVTCRDWFQLTLKEGLTVYREQEFSADMNSRAVSRLNHVRILRARQFAEDLGAMAHPIRPDSYLKIDNFYTATVYDKGCEIIRLYESVLGKEGFRKGMDLYFKRHDGFAVTCDDFLAAMADANGRDLSALGRWYGQAGTPELRIATTYDPARAGGTFTVTLTQRTAPTPGQETKVPVLIPVRLGLLSGVDGKPVPLSLTTGGKDTEIVLPFEHNSATYAFEGVGTTTAPVLSALRGFSAPVKCIIEGQTDDELTFLLKHDTDGFNRYEAGQVLAKKTVLQLYNGQITEAPAKLIEAYRTILEDASIDGQFKAYALSLPTISELTDMIPECDPVRLYHILYALQRSIAGSLYSDLVRMVDRSQEQDEKPYAFNAGDVARRAIINKAFGMLSTLEEPAIEQRLLSRMRCARNMTDEIATLGCLNYACPSREVALQEFYDKWKSEPLVVLKWFTIHATCNIPGNSAKVQGIVQSDKFNIKNPNSVYALLGAFASSPVNFHAADYSGYAFMAKNVLAVDKVNHQVAARLVSSFTTLKQYSVGRQAAMRSLLQLIVATEGISANVSEIANKSLKS